MIPSCHVCGELIRGRKALGAPFGTRFKLGDEDEPGNDGQFHSSRLDLASVDPRNMAGSVEWVHQECVVAWLEQRFAHLEQMVAEEKKKPKLRGTGLIDPTTGQELALPEDEDATRDWNASQELSDEGASDG